MEEKELEELIWWLNEIWEERGEPVQEEESQIFFDSVGHLMIISALGDTGVIRYTPRRKDL